MDIAAISTSMHQSSIAQQVSVSVLKIAMDTAKANGEALTKIMENSVTPNLGQNIDLKV